MSFLASSSWSDAPVSQSVSGCLTNLVARGAATAAAIQVTNFCLAPTSPPPPPVSASCVSLSGGFCDKGRPFGGICYSQTAKERKREKKKEKEEKKEKESTATSGTPTAMGAPNAIQRDNKSTG